MILGFFSASMLLGIYFLLVVFSIFNGYGCSVCMYVCVPVPGSEARGESGSIPWNGVTDN